MTKPLDSFGRVPDNEDMAGNSDRLNRENEMTITIQKDFITHTFWFAVDVNNRVVAGPYKHLGTIKKRVASCFPDVEVIIDIDN